MKKYTLLLLMNYIICGIIIYTSNEIGPKMVKCFLYAIIELSVRLATRMNVFS